MNVGFVSLGCSKNLIDTEVMIGKFKNNKHKIVNNPKEAEIIVINPPQFNQIFLASNFSFCFVISYKSSMSVF